MSSTHEKMPSIYIPHGGGPCFFMDWPEPNPWASMGAFLESLSGELPRRPRALLVVSAHWDASAFTVGSAAHPDLIYDYYGFPPHTYEIQYPASGDPDLSRRARDLLDAAGIVSAEDSARGFDHGVFIPLKLVYPDADIPIVQLSLRSDYDPAAHLAAGAALQALRDDDVLILGSGMSFHNMRALREPGFRIEAAQHSEIFDAWLSGAITAPDAGQRTAQLVDWAAAPSARVAHPPRGEEHLLPLMVAAGAGGLDRACCIYSDNTVGGRISAYRFG